MDYTVGVMPLTQVNKPPFTIEVPGVTKVQGETIPRRHPAARDGLLTQPAEGITSVFDIVRHSAREYPNHKAVGSRKLVKVHNEKKKIQKIVDGQPTEVEKEWQYFELTGYSFLTYKEYETLVLQLGSGLAKLGLTSANKLHFFASTSMNWLSLSHAAASQAIPIVTAYDTLGSSGLEHSLIQAECETMYVEPTLLKIAAGPIKKSNIKTVIINSDSMFAIGNEAEEFKKNNPELNVYTYEEVRKLGEENMVDPVPVDPSAVYCIMYTSGSTGLPKGACITHESLIAGLTGLLTCIRPAVSDKEVILTYLPLAHIFEMALENLGLFIGARLGYGNPKTLSDASMKNCGGDMRELKPTVMVGVPQIWETVKKGVMAKLNSSPALVKSMFWGAYSYKDFMTRHRLPGANIFDGLVFGKVREMTGGRLRFTMNGASGIADGTRNFLSLVLGPMLGGYGLTETCANGSLGSPLEYSSTAIGPVPASVDVKLVAIPDLGYSTEAAVPQGEIWIKGLPVMKEYYKNPEETSKAITSDGWFKTGDIGEFDADGHLKIIDRVKNLVKMQGGEYIALEKLESVYRGSQLVTNVMVYADPDHTRPIAIVMPNEKILAAKAKELGVDEHEMHTNAKVKAATLKDLQVTGKQAGLTGLETVAAIVITDEEWTPNNNLVTATQKLNRKNLRERFKAEINECLKTAP